MLRRLLFIFCFLPMLSLGQGYRHFDNIKFHPETSRINFITQDPANMIWFGTGEGLYCYDGYSVRQHFEFGQVSNTGVYCGLFFDESLLYLGTDNGLLSFDIRKDRYLEPIENSPHEIRTLARDGNRLWLGTLNGLYTYDLATKAIEKISRQNNPGLPHETIYSVVRGSDGCIYVGTYDGFCRRVPGSDSFERISLPNQRRKSNLFVNSILEDTARGCIWIGTEGQLFLYTPSNGKIAAIDRFNDNSVKSLALDKQGNLLAGTDNGLYVYNENAPVKHITHDTRDPQSLSNNIIWNIFADRDNNIWLGTDHGVSLSRPSGSFQYVPLAQVAGSGEGNHFYCILKDSKGDFWLGGTNGLIRWNEAGGQYRDVAWYNMESQRNHLPHNRVRNIYEDRDGMIWIASDGGVNRYDQKTRRFAQYNITDPTGSSNSNWVYDITEDEEGKLWVATFLGGVFVVDKEALLASTSGKYVAEHHYSTHNGLSGASIGQIVADRQAGMWVLSFNGIDRIDRKQGSITNIDIAKSTSGQILNRILCDDQGRVWGGFRGGAIVLDPTNKEHRVVRFSEFGNSANVEEVLSMEQVGSNILLSTTNGVWAVDTKTYRAKRLNIAEMVFSSLLYDPQAEVIYMGTMDGFAKTSPAILSGANSGNPVVITAMYVNNEPVSPQSDICAGSIRYASGIALSHKQNNISFEFSDLTYSPDGKNKFVYRLEGFETGWNLPKPGTNTISYNNLDHGDYKLVISRLDEYGVPSDELRELSIHIRAPWYATRTAYIAYALLLLALAAWTVNFFRVKNRLKFERLERQKNMELSNLKIDFFTNISHEFKTPLSLIIAPLSRMLLETKDQKKRRQLEEIQDNAQKINTLIHQALNFNINDLQLGLGLILSRIEFVGFASSLFSVYKDVYAEKNLEFSFSSSVEELYVEIDVLKIESVLNNLISNACKYTPEAGRVTLSVDYNDQDKALTFSVSDTGIGIPQDEIRYVSERYYQSSKTSAGKQGTGIGLFTVSRFVEQHGGEFSIKSAEDSGTIVSVTLFVKAVEQIEVEKPEQITPEDSSKPLILVVEDNAGISKFISEILSDEFRCITAPNGKKGIEMCERHNPDLIVADIMMPVMDGMEMSRRLKKNAATATIPIILLTAKDDKNAEIESVGINVEAFMSKPFYPDLLTSKIRQLLYTRRKLQDKMRLDAICQPEAIQAVSIDEKFLKAVTDIIEEHIADPDLNVNMLCDLSGIGSKQTYRKLKQLTGMSPVEYIRSVRMKKAAMLIAQQKFTIAEVMYMVGFSNHSYFAKCFQAAFGKNPKSYSEGL